MNIARWTCLICLMSVFLSFGTNRSLAEALKTESMFVENTVFDIADNGDNLLLASSQGLVKFDKTSFARTYYTEENSAIPSDDILSVAIVGGSVWVGTNLNGIGVFDGAEWDSLTISNSGLATNVGIFDIFVTEDDGIWIADGYWVCQVKDDVWTSYDVIDESSATGTRSIGRDNLGRILTGSQYGTSAIQDGVVTTCDDIPSGLVSCFTVAADSTLWFGVGGVGLYSLKDGILTVETPENSGLPFTGIRSVAFDRDGRLWIAGDGLAVRNGNGWQVYTTNDFLFLEHLGPDLCDDDGVVWCGTTQHGLLRFHDGDLKQFDIIPDITGIGEGPVPEAIELAPAFPNPFNPATTISFTLPERMPVTLAVYNLAGQKVVTLMEGLVGAGTHEVVFDSTGLASGVYVYRLETAGFSGTGKMLLMK